MWEMTSAADNSEELENRLREGWEPFDVTWLNQSAPPIIWLRRNRGRSYLHHP